MSMGLTSTKPSEETLSVGLPRMWWLAYPAQLCKIALVCGRPRIVRLVCSCPLLPFPPQSIRCGLPHRDGFWTTAHWYVRHMSASEWRVLSLDKVMMWRTNNTIGRQHVCKAQHSAQHAGMLRFQASVAVEAGSYGSYIDGLQHLAPARRRTSVPCAPPPPLPRPE